jgi:NAD(P)H-flavin reductase
LTDPELISVKSGETSNNVEQSVVRHADTADKMQSQRIFLFGYGVGAGVVKALAEHFVTVSNVPELTIMTGSRSGNEILHKEYFDTLPALSSGATVRYVLSANEPGPYRIGYIQDHVGDFDFTNSDVYVCGQEVACQALVETIKKTNPKQCNFFIEGFH